MKVKNLSSILFLVAVGTGSLSGMATGVLAAKKLIENFKINSSSQKTAIMVTGGVGGMVVGGGLAAVGNFAILEKDKNCQIWSKDCQNTTLRASMRDRFGEDEILQHFICPLSLTPILCPARSPAGHLYEYEALIKCIDPNSGLIKDPLRISDATGSIFFHPSAILEDFETAIVVEKRLRFLLEQDLQELDPESNVYAILASHATELKKIVRAEYRKAQNEIRLRRENGETSSMSEEEEDKIRQQFDVETAVFHHHFGRVASQDLDWENTDWPELLNSRWKLFPH